MKKQYNQQEDSFLEDVEDPNKDFSYGSPESVYMDNTPKIKSIRHRVILSDSEQSKNESFFEDVQVSDKDFSSPESIQINNTPKKKSFHHRYIISDREEDEESSKDYESLNDDKNSSRNTVLSKKDESFEEDYESLKDPMSSKENSFKNESSKTENIYFKEQITSVNFKKKDILNISLRSNSDKTNDIVKTSEIITLTNSPYKEKQQIVQNLSDNDLESFSNSEDNDIVIIENNSNNSKTDLEFLRKRRLSNIRKKYPQCKDNFTIF